MKIAYICKVWTELKVKLQTSTVSGRPIVKEEAERPTLMQQVIVPTASKHQRGKFVVVVVFVFVNATAIMPMASKHQRMRRVELK